MVNERPELNMDSSWSETGDRYVIKLFRDYLFHQVGEEGEPVLDVGHMVETLNKLDVADAEQILLMSRDNRSMLVVSFADIQRCLQTSFEELLQAADKRPGGGGPPY